MYPTVTVKGLSGLLVVLLVFSEVHSFIFEDEGGTGFCIRADNIQKNETTEKWLESSCNGPKVELSDRMKYLGYNGIPKQDFRRSSMMMKEVRMSHNKPETSFRRSHGNDQVQKSEVVRTRFAYRNDYTTVPRFTRSLNRRLIEDNGFHEENRRMDSHQADVRSARTNEYHSTVFNDARIAREPLNRVGRSIEFRLITRIRTSSIDDPSLKRDETRSSNFDRRRRYIDHRASESTRRVERSLNNRARSPDNSRFFRSDSSEVSASRGTRRRELNEFHATRFLETRVARLTDNALTRSDDIRTERRIDIRAPRLNEVSSVRSDSRRSRSLEDSATRFAQNRIERSNFRYTASQSELDMRVLENRIVETAKNRRQRSPATQARRYNNRISVTRSDNARLARSSENHSVRSDDFISIELNNVRVSRQNENTRSFDTFRRRPVRSLDDNRSTRFEENRVDILSSRCSRTSDSLRVERNNLAVRSADDRRNTRINEHQSSRSADTRTERLMESSASRLSENRSSSSRSIRSRETTVKSVDRFMVREAGRIGSRIGVSLKERGNINMFSNRNRMQSARSDQSISSNTKRDSSRILNDLRFRRNDIVRDYSRIDNARCSNLRMETSRNNGGASELKTRFVGDILSRRTTAKTDELDLSIRSSNQFSPNSGRRNMELRMRQLENIRGVRVEDSQVDNLRKYREFEVGKSERRSNNLIGSREDESVKLSRRIGQLQLVTVENSGNERRIISKGIRSFTRETRGNSLFARSEGNRLARIREFGNDNRQRQNIGIRLREVTTGSRDTRDARVVLIRSNLDHISEQMRLVTPSRRFTDRVGNNRLREYSQNIRVDVRRTEGTETRANISRVLNLSRRRLVKDDRLITQWQDKTSSNQDTLRRLGDQLNLRKSERSIYKMDSRRRMADISRSRAALDVSRSTEYGMRGLQYTTGVSGRQTIRDIRRIETAKAMNAEVTNLRMKAEHINTVRFERVYHGLRKTDKEDYIPVKEGVVGFSSNGKLQLTLATILVGQLIFSKLRISKGSNLNIDWIRNSKIF